MVVAKQRALMLVNSRLEVQCRGQTLKDYGVVTFEDLETKHRNIWTDLTTNWITICEPSATDSKRSRWNQASWWSGVINASTLDHFPPPLARSAKHDRAPSIDHLMENFIKVIASVTAASGGETFEDAIAITKNVIQNPERYRGVDKNFSLKEVFQATIKTRIRSYNLRAKKTASERLMEIET